MKKSIKYIIAFFVVVLVIVGVYFSYVTFLDPNSSTATSVTNNMNENSSMTLEENHIEENVIENEVINEPEVLVDEPEKIMSENDESDKTVSDEDVTTQNEDSELESVDNEQKAIEIVKKDWGITDGVVYRSETITANGNYEISVRDASTMNAIAWYTVNPITGEFSN